MKKQQVFPFILTAPAHPLLHIVYTQVNCTAVAMAHHEMEGVGVDYDGGALLAVEEKPGLWAAGGSEGMFGTTPFTRTEAQAIAQRLNMPLARCETRTRPGPGGTQLTYIEGWKVVQEANLLFGYNGWSSKVLKETIHYVEAQGAGRFSVAATALVRVTLRDGTSREDSGGGTCDGMRNKGDAIVKAIKEAVTDATKRALKGFGPRLGLCLYDKEHIREMKKGPPPMRTPNAPPQGSRRPTPNQNHQANAHRTPPAQQGTRQVAAAHRQAAAVHQRPPNAPMHHGAQAANAQLVPNTSSHGAPPAPNRRMQPNAPHPGGTHNVKMESARGNAPNAPPQGGSHNSNANGNGMYRPGGHNAHQAHGNGHNAHQAHGNGAGPGPGPGPGQAVAQAQPNGRRNSTHWQHPQEAQHHGGQQHMPNAARHASAGTALPQQTNGNYNHNGRGVRPNSGMGAPPPRPTSAGGQREAGAQTERRQQAHVAVGATIGAQVGGGAPRRGSAQSTSNYGRPPSATHATPMVHGRPQPNTRHPHAPYHASPVTPAAVDVHHRGTKRRGQDIPGPTQQRARDALVKNELDELKHIDPGNFY